MTSDTVICGPNPPIKKVEKSSSKTAVTNRILGVVAVKAVTVLAVSVLLLFAD